jgi:hypothetical protein
MIYLKITFNSETKEFYVICPCCNKPTNTKHCDSCYSCLGNIEDDNGTQYIVCNEEI